MGLAKDIRIAPISVQDARRIVRELHYSGKVVPNSKVHLGAFLGDRCCGVMQFGPAMFQDRMCALVRGSTPDSFLELNRMAFSEALPRNSESRAIGIACRMLRQKLPTLRWLLSFADATQCGDGAIYRASGFLLTQIKRNDQLRRDPATGRVVQSIAAWHKGLTPEFHRWEAVPGYSLRYVRFLDPTWRDRLTCAAIPFSRIEELGARMVRGRPVDTPPSGERP